MKQRLWNIENVKNCLYYNASKKTGDLTIGQLALQKLYRQGVIERQNSIGG